MKAVGTIGQFVTVKGKRPAVLSAEDWEAFVEWLVDVEEVQIAREAFARLKAAGGDRQKAGWLDWDEVDKEVVAIRKWPPYDYGDLEKHQILPIHRLGGVRGMLFQFGQKCLVESPFCCCWERSVQASS